MTAEQQALVEQAERSIDAQAQRTCADYDPTPNLSQFDAERLATQAQTFLTIARQNLNA